MKQMRLFATTVVPLFLLLAVGAPHASANVVTFPITSDDCGGPGCFPGMTSAGTITVTDTTGGVAVDVTLNSGIRFVHTGFDTDFGFNLSGTPIIIYASITTGFAATGGSPQSAGTLHMDGTGDFEYGVTCTVCSSGSSNAQSGPLDFTITGNALSSASFVQNAQLQYFAVDVIGPNGKSGAVDASVATTIVPDGGMTLMLLGGALVGLETLRRRFSA